MDRHDPGLNIDNRMKLQEKKSQGQEFLKEGTKMTRTRRRRTLDVGSAVRLSNTVLIASTLTVAIRHRVLDPGVSGR